MKNCVFFLIYIFSINKYISMLVMDALILVLTANIDNNLMGARSTRLRYCAALRAYLELNSRAMKMMA